MKEKMNLTVKRAFSMVLAIVMLVNMFPAKILAREEEKVYISVSHDGQFVTDKNGEYVTYMEVPMSELADIDFAEYGLEDYYYDGDGDENYDITALHLYIYTHENIFGHDWSEVTVTGGAGSIYFNAGLFGFQDENLTYYRNGAYPEIMPGWGATADQLVLSNGDFYDIAHYTDYAFWMDSMSGYHYFLDANGGISHSFEVEEMETLTTQLVRTYGGLGFEGGLEAEWEDYEVFYGTTLETPTGTVVTDENGYIEVSFPFAGTWYLWCNGGYGGEYPDAIVSAPAYAKVTVTAKDVLVQPETPARQPQDVSAVLNATMAKLAATVTAPSFGTNAGEWTVLSLARGEYYNAQNTYFREYYNRIVKTVNEQAASVNLNGALHSSKSTDNSRLIVALSSIGKDATGVGNWNLVAPYEDFSWIKNQGINGVIWGLIALDSHDYQTKDTTIRQQCLEYILGKQLEDGGWALSGNVVDPDITGMVLQALYPYRENSSVALAAENAFAKLSAIQDADGGFSSWNSTNSESCAQVIVACTTWGINPDTDVRFVKNNKSVVDALLAYYVEEEAAFKHVAAGTVNDMATDQACYALVAYNRFRNNKTALYNMSDVTFEDVVIPTEIAATLGMPEKVENMVGTTFHVTLNMSGWDNAEEYKLIDFILSVPEGISVAEIKAGNRLNGGAVSYHLEEESGKLRVVYFDANENKSLTVSGSSFPAEFFDIVLRIDKKLEDENLNIAITGMSVKKTSDAYDEENMVIVNTDNAQGTVQIVEGITFSAICLYQGDGVDLIPESKKAVMLAVTALEGQPQITYKDSSNEIDFIYNREFSEKVGVTCYVALVDASISMTKFAEKENYVISEEIAENITLGDVNGDGVINAQDALGIVDAWLRKDEAPKGKKILSMNVNGDSRINTFDALGIVEVFVNDDDFNVLTNVLNLNLGKEL